MVKTNTLAVLALCALGSSAFAVGQLWDVRIGWGDNNSWLASANPTSWEMTTNDGGQTVISGSWQGAAWSCDWELIVEGAYGGLRATTPFLSSSFNMTNNTGITQNFEFMATLNTFALPGPNDMFGSISGSVGDGNPPTGATVSTWGPGESFYAAMIDNNIVRTLHDHNTSVSAPPAGTNNIPTLNYGPEGTIALLNEIAIRNRFTLTALDNAQMTSTFFVIPAPGAAGLLALAGLTAARRRR